MVPCAGKPSPSEAVRNFRGTPSAAAFDTKPPDSRRGQGRLFMPVERGQYILCTARTGHWPPRARRSIAWCAASSGSVVVTGTAGAYIWLRRSPHPQAEVVLMIRGGAVGFGQQMRWWTSFEALMNWS